MGRILLSFVGASIAVVIYASLYILFSEKVVTDSNFNDSISYMCATIALIFIIPAISHNPSGDSSSIARIGLAVIIPALSSMIFCVSSYLCFTDYQKLWKVSILCGLAVLWIGILLLMIVTIFNKKNRGEDNVKL
jgi:hypothetical protein